jgi:transmembrane sensor
LAWKSTQLVFDHTPLDQVVAAFNHYNTRILVLADPALKSRTLTGSFSAENLDGFTRLLRASVDVITESSGDGQILLRPAP